MQTNQLTISNNSTSSLTLRQQQYAVALQSPLVHVTKPVDLETILIDAISVCFFQTGKKIDGSDDEVIMEISVLAQAMQRELHLYFRFFTVEEVKLAFEKGLRKEYGEYYGLSVITFHNWLKAFQMDRTRIENLKRQQQEAEPKPKELSPEEQKELVVEGVLRCWHWFKQTTQFNELQGGYHLLTCFEYLHSNAILNFSLEQRIQFGRDAKKLLKERLINEKHKVAGNEVSIRDIVKELELIDKKDNILVINEAKKLALQSFFQSLIEMETDLLELMNLKLND